jgi:hypothetical protein
MEIMGRIENQWWLYCRCHLDPALAVGFWNSIGNSGRQLWTIDLVRFFSPASTGHISAWVLECGEWLLELAEEGWSLRRGYPMDVFG